MISNLLDRMKLPFRKNKEFLSVLYNILGFYPHNIEIYRIAFSHKSISHVAAPSREDSRRNRGRDRRGRGDDRRNRSEAPTKPLNNERLEYLGDAVLETVTSDILFRHFPTRREGFLTATRSKLVQREALNRLAADMGLDKLILAAQGTRMSHTNIGGNAFEALMGAIYLDRGYKYCHWFITHRVIGRYVDLDKVAQKEVNFKSKLLEWSQKNRIRIDFKDTQAEGERGFTTVIVIEGLTIARGEGRAKKDSQQEASKEALTRMRREAKTYDSIFRAKEKRTAMEAEESFALPKIDEIENNLAKSRRTKRESDKTTAPVLETPRSRQAVTDEAYDTAYDADATYEVIDTPPTEARLTTEDYEAKGIPAPPAENELDFSDDKLRKKHQRGRGPKTVGDAVKGMTKGASTPEEKAARANREREEERERSRRKAERRAKAEAQAQKKAERADEKSAVVPTEPAPAEIPAEKGEKSVAKAEQPTEKAEHVVAKAENIDAKADETTQDFLIKKDLTPIGFPEPISDEELSTLNAQTTETETTPEAVSVAEASHSEVLTADFTTDTDASANSAAEDKATAQSVANETIAATAPAPQSAAVASPSTEDTTPVFEEEKSVEEASTSIIEETTPLFEEENSLFEEKTLSFEEETLTAEEALPSFEEDAPSTAESTTAIDASQPLPRLRHLSLDDFVFGMEDTDETTSVAPDENDEAASAASKPNRRGRKQRSSRKPRQTEKTSDYKGEKEETSAAPTDEQTSEGETEKRSPARRRNGHRGRRRPGPKQTDSSDKE